MKSSGYPHSLSRKAGTISVPSRKRKSRFLCCCAQRAARRRSVVPCSLPMRLFLAMQRLPQRAARWAQRLNEAFGQGTSLLRCKCATQICGFGFNRSAHPGSRDVRVAHIAAPWAVYGHPLGLSGRCGVIPVATGIDAAEVAVGHAGHGGDRHVAAAGLCVVEVVQHGQRGNGTVARPEVAFVAWVLRAEFK